MSDIIRYSNFAQSNLTQAVTAEDTVINLSDDGTLPEGFFTCVMWSASESSPMEDANRELVLLKRASTGVFDAVRGIEGTIPSDWKSGTKVANIVTAGSMDFIHDAARISTSITEVYDNTYNMVRSDTKILFHFDVNEGAKSVTLPEIALCEGLIFRITSKALNLTQKVRLTVNTDDLFTHTSKNYIDLHKGMTLLLMATAHGWTLIDQNQPDYSEAKTVTNSSDEISFTNKIVFIDASERNVSLSLPHSEEIYGIPLTIIRSDNSNSRVTITNPSDGGESVYLSSQNESITVVKNRNNNINIINHFIPKQTPVLSVDSSTALGGNEELVLADASNSYVAIYLPTLNSFRFKNTTIKKIDSTSNPIYLLTFSETIDGSYAPIVLSSQWDYVTITSDGNNWFKVG